MDLDLTTDALPEEIKQNRVHFEGRSDFIPYGRQWIDGEDIRAAVNILRSRKITQGPTVEEFEEGLSGYCGAKHALHGFFEALRAEVYDHGISISMVLPGFIATDISLNAVVGDGSKQGTMDAKTGAGMTPMQCAKKLARGVDRKKPEILIGRSEILAVYLKRFFPRLLRRIIRRAAVT